uniref:RING-type E3 ubiquitin transferase n=1 Tax=Myxobolus squamalis TaxID=59785 RepID=A0A6B2G2K0_MYXSQ
MSNYIVPSYYFPQNFEEKQTIITSYREALKQKHCIHFNRGRSHCPFSTSCFFKHEFPDGTLADESHLLVNSDGYYQIYSPYCEDGGSFSDIPFHLLSKDKYSS